MTDQQYTQRATGALNEAVVKAQKMHHTQVEPLHILSALIEQEDTASPALIKEVGGSIENIKSQVKEALSSLPTLIDNAHEPKGSQNTAEVLIRAEKEMKKVGDEFISTEHLLLALLSTSSTAKKFWKRTMLYIIKS